MKKIIALVLSVVLICCCSVTAFAAESPTAGSKVTVTIRKADSVAPTEKVDIKYTVDKGAVISVKADEAKYGKFDSWSIYKATEVADGVSAPVKSGVITLNAARNLATKITTTTAVEGTDYEIVSGSLTAKELTVKVNTDVIICGNYKGVITNPLTNSTADNSAVAPQTGDMTVLYATIIMLAVVAFGFGVKKVYCK
ncbi:MAG: hypothetical protein Q4B40_06645 [Clostridia bacterium]|nr:hypothetical protein [Clostridia bacterium]